jgi:hypothetical protein
VRDVVSRETQDVREVDGCLDAASVVRFLMARTRAPLLARAALP